MSDTRRVRPARPPQPGPAAGPTAGMAQRPGPIDIVRLLTELVAFGALAAWGFTSFALPWNIVAGIGAPLFAILLWALFVSPRAVVAVHPFIAAVVELLVFVTATLALWSMGQAWVGLAFGLVAVATGVLVGRRRFS